MSRGHRTPTPAQKDRELASALRAIRVICERWPIAVEDANSIGWPRQSPGLRAVPTEYHHDGNDPLHTRTMPPASGKASGCGQPVEAMAIAGLLGADKAAAWLQGVRKGAAALLHLSGMVGSAPPDWRPIPFQRDRLELAARELVTAWPRNAPVILAHLHRMANDARALFPPTPKRGSVVDGVKVLERIQAVELCAECGGPVAGGSADPLRRVDGRPYHKKPCYDAARQRAYRLQKKNESPRRGLPLGVVVLRG